MRESSLQTLVDRRHALLDQASAALRGRVVALWRMVREDQAVTEIVSALKTRCRLSNSISPVGFSGGPGGSA
jgi:hypothetical protein